MRSLPGSFRRLLFGMSADETSFARRGFRGGGSGIREHVEQIGATFVRGYHAALEHSTRDPLLHELNAIESEWRGFAFEGAAMGLALLDLLVPWRRRRVDTLLKGVGQEHLYMIHVGAGWLMARLPINPTRFRRRFEPLFSWLALDGYGFHEGFFRWPTYLSGRIPPQLRDYELRAFDQGLGRSLWFVDGADVERLPRTIASFAPGRQADLWSGVGLAATYAGGVEEQALKELWDAADTFQPQLAQGAAFAAKARLRAGNSTPATAAAVRVFCGLSVEESAQIADDALENLPSDDLEPAYEIWRRRIQDRFKLSEVIR